MLNATMNLCAMQCAKLLSPSLARGMTRTGWNDPRLAERTFVLRPLAELGGSIEPWPAAARHAVARARPLRAEHGWPWRGSEARCGRGQAHAAPS